MLFDIFNRNQVAKAYLEHGAFLQQKSLTIS